MKLGATTWASSNFATSVIGGRMQAVYLSAATTRDQPSKAVLFNLVLHHWSTLWSLILIWLQSLVRRHSTIFTLYCKLRFLLYFLGQTSCKRVTIGSMTAPGMKMRRHLHFLPWVIVTLHVFNHLFKRFIWGLIWNGRPWLLLPGGAASHVVIWDSDVSCWMRDWA